MTEEVIPWKIYLQVVQLLCLIIVQTLGTVGHILDRTDRRYTVELPTGRVIHWNHDDLRPTSVEFQCICQPNISIPADVQKPVPTTTDTCTTPQS